MCGAAGLADELNDQVIEAINAGRIPPVFQEDLQARANELVNAVNCPQPTDEDQSDDDGDDDEPTTKDKKDKKKDDEKPEELLPAEPLPTVPEEDE